VTATRLIVSAGTRPRRPADADNSRCRLRRTRPTPATAGAVGILRAR